MPLIEGQFQIRDLVLGPHTPYRVLVGTNPFVRNARTTGGGARAWNHGSWAGAEWMDEAVVPLTLMVEANNTSEWLERHQELQAAFRPIGDLAETVELRFQMGGREYVMFGRPRMVEPELHTVQGNVITKAGFVALDPLIYGGVEVEHTMGLPTFTGGLTVPFTVPFTVDGTQAGGFADLVNDGTADTGLMLRIDGPVDEPRVTLSLDAGPQTLRIDVDLATGQWLDIDTAARTVLLNGVSSRRGQTSGDWPILPKGTHRLRFGAADFNASASLTSTHRSAWW